MLFLILDRNCGNTKSLKTSLCSSKFVSIFSQPKRWVELFFPSQYSRYRFLALSTASQITFFFTVLKTVHSNCNRAKLMLHTSFAPVPFMQSTHHAQELDCMNIIITESLCHLACRHLMYFWFINYNRWEQASVNTFVCLQIRSNCINVLIWQR